MKTKFLFASLVASAVMVGCSNEELADVQNTASDDNLALIFDGFEGVESRMAYDGSNGTFKWEVGDQIGVSRVAGKGVTTNYLFNATKVTDDNTLPLSSWNTEEDGAGDYAYFETTFGSIFKGDYVVYYPYNPDFCEDGKIVAKLNIGQTEVAASKEAHVAEDGFMMSKAVAFEGGQKAEKFALYPVFGRLVVNIKTADNCDIETIVLRSLNGATLPTAMEIDADINVVNGKLNPAYMHVVESSKVEEIVMSVDGEATANASTGYTAYFTLIPGTYTNFAIDVVTDKGSFTKTFTSASISTGSRAEVNLSFAADDMILKRTYYATSAASWKTAVDKIASSMTVSEAAPATIKVMNDIVLDEENTFRPENEIHTLVPVTVEGVGSIEIPKEAIGLGAMTNVTFNVPVNAEEFTSVQYENVVFAAGLKAGVFNLSHGGSSYTIKGGEIGKTTIYEVNTSALTAENVKFTNLVTSNQTANLANNVAKINFNNCTFEAGLTNTAGSIKVNGATIVDPNADDNVYSELNVTGGTVYVKNAIDVENVDVGETGELNLEDGNTAVTNNLAAITGIINVSKDAALTLGSSVEYKLEGKIKVEGKLVNNGTLTAGKEAVIDDIAQNNNKGVLENNGIVRVGVTAYDGVWYNNQNITFVNNAEYNVILWSSDGALNQDYFKKYVAKTDVTGIELNSNKNDAYILLQGRGTADSGASVIDFSDKNLILNANKAGITAVIVNGLKFKNVTVKGSNDVVLMGATQNAAINTKNLTIDGKLTMFDSSDDTNDAKANVTNVTVGSNATLTNGKQINYTGSFANNNGTVAGGNPMK